MRFTMIVVLFFLYQNYSTAAEVLGRDLNALGVSCGDKTEAGATGVEEIVTCYRKGIENFFRGKLTPLGTAFDVCDSFTLESRQYACLLDYKEEAQDSSLYSLFGECTLKEKDMSKKSQKTLSCLKDKVRQDPKKYIFETGEDIQLTNPSTSFMTFVNKTCGSKDAIYTIYKDNIRNLADCYQTALLNLKPELASVKFNSADLAIKLCTNFETQLERLDCYRRAAAEIKQPQYSEAVEQCAHPKGKIKKPSPEEAFKQIKYREGAGYDLTQKKYGVVTNCIRDAFQSLRAPQNSANGASAPTGKTPASSGRR